MRLAFIHNFDLTICLLAISFIVTACTFAFGSAAQEDPLVGTRAVLQCLNGHEPLKDTQIRAEFVE